MGIEQKDNILDEDGALIPLSLFVRRIKISIFALPDFFMNSRGLLLNSDRNRVLFILFKKIDNFVEIII